MSLSTLFSFQCYNRRHAHRTILTYPLFFIESNPPIEPAFPAHNTGTITRNSCLTFGRMGALRRQFKLWIFLGMLAGSMAARTRSQASADRVLLKDVQVR